MGLLLRLSFFLARSFGDQSSRLWAPAQLIPKPLGQVTTAVQCGQVTAAAAADSLSPQRADMLEVHVMPPHLELLWVSSNCLTIFRGKAPPSPALRCCPFPLACPEIHLNELQARVWDSLGRAGHLSNLQLLEKKEATHGPGFVPGARNTGSLKNSGGSLGTQQDLTPLPVSRCLFPVSKCLSCTTLSETGGGKEAEDQVSALSAPAIEVQRQKGSGEPVRRGVAYNPDHISFVRPSPRGPDCVLSLVGAVMQL